MRHRPPPDVERLLTEHIGSVGTLEVLLVLRDGEPRQVAEICAALASPRSWTELQLDALARGGMLVGNAADGWTYAPVTPRLARTVDRLVHAWELDHRTVGRWILGRGRRA